MTPEQLAALETFAAAVREHHDALKVVEAAVAKIEAKFDLAVISRQVLEFYEEAIHRATLILLPL